MTPTSYAPLEPPPDKTRALLVIPIPPIQSIILYYIKLCNVNTK